MKIYSLAFVLASVITSITFGDLASSVPTFEMMFENQHVYPPEKVAEDVGMRHVIADKYNRSSELPPIQFLYILRVMRHSFVRANLELETLIKALEENIQLKEQYIKGLEKEKKDLRDEINQLTRSIEELTRKLRNQKTPLS